MFGIYRTFLSLAVVLHHLISIPVIGQFAVHGFFILSGYLMTYVMINSYGFNKLGVKNFAINRFLRLYPSYWFILLISIFIIWHWGSDQSMEYREFMYIPDSFSSLVQNISLVYISPFPTSIYPRVSPPTWALSIELLFYMVIALGISKSKRATTVWFCISALYMFLTHILNLNHNFRYNLILSGSLPFAVGAIIYHYKDSEIIKRLNDLKSYVTICLLIMFILNSAIAALAKKTEYQQLIFNFCFYLNYIINFLIVTLLIHKKLPLITPKIDKIVGDFSYPVYLMHWQVGFASSMLLWGQPIRGFSIQGIISCSFALVICFIVSLAIIKFIDGPIEKYRFSIKNGNKQG